MHRSESSGLVSCVECGVQLRSGRDREFEFGSRAVLCFDCALRRGGRFDENLDRWSAEPRIDDLGPEVD